MNPIKIAHFLKIMKALRFGELITSREWKKNSYIHLEKVGCKLKLIDENYNNMTELLPDIFFRTEKFKIYKGIE